MPADIAFGLLTAGGLTAVAAIPLLVLGILNLSAPAGLGAPVTSWSDYAVLWLAIPGAYFAAGLTGGIYFWALRPLRAHALGWGLTGAVVAIIPFTAMGLAVWSFPGPFLALKPESPLDGLGFITYMIPIVGPAGFAWGVWKWYRPD